MRAFREGLIGAAAATEWSRNAIARDGGGAAAACFDRFLVLHFFSECIAMQKIGLIFIFFFGEV